MPKRVMYTGGFPRQLDLPEKIASNSKGEDGKPTTRKVDRSCAGSLHLKPGRIHVLTDDELELAREYKDLRKQLRVLGDAPGKKDETAKKAPLAKPEASPKAKGGSGDGNKSRAKAKASSSGTSSAAASEA